MNRKSGVLLVVIVVAALLFVAAWRMRQSSLDYQAAHLLRMQLKGDAAGMWRFVAPEERELYGLDYTEFERLCAQFVTPTMRKRPSEGSIKTTVLPQSGQATATLETTGPDAVRKRMTVCVTRTPDGLIEEDLINQVIVQTILLRTPEQPNVIPQERMLAGFIRDRQLLQSLGIHGLRNGYLGFQTWDEVIARQRLRVEHAKARASAAL